MWKLRKQIVLAAFLALSNIPAHAAPITGLFVTGVDGASTVLADGATDTHYAILETGTNAIAMANHPAWIPNDLTSKWVWQQSNGQPTNVTRTFRQTFDLTGLDHTTAAITGTWAVDNSGLNILINGTATGNTAPGFTAYANFSINSGFIAGINTLDFVVQDVGVISGFRVGSISGTANALSSVNVPEPITLSLLGAGLLSLGAIRRRRD